MLLGDLAMNELVDERLRRRRSYFFPTPAEGVATGSQPLEVGRRPVRDDALVDGHGRGVHLLGIDDLHIPSADGATFFVLVVAQERSGRFRTSVAPKYFFQRFQ